MSYRSGKGRLSGACACVALAGGVATNAHAQTSVTLYGVLDAGLIYTSKSLGTNGTNAGHLFAFNDSGLWGTSFGMTGIEDLGGGLKVKFKLESGTSLANGAVSNSNGNPFGRMAWVGLDSDKYGEIRAGVQWSPFMLSVYAADSRGSTAFFGSGMVSYVGNVLVTGMFNANAIAYESPKIAGLTGSAMIALGGTPGDFSAGKQYSFRLTYDLGSVHLDAAMYNGNAGGSAAATPYPSTIEFAGRALGISYYVGNLTWRASYTLYKVAGAFDSQVYSTGFSFGITPSWNIDAGAWYTRDGNDSTNHSILAAAGTEYALSKRTVIYAQAAVVNNHGKMNTGVTAGLIALYEPAGTTSAVNVGIRHTF